MKNEIEIALNVATSIISGRPPKTLVGRILRWVKRLNSVRNSIGIKIK